MIYEAVIKINEVLWGSILLPILLGCGLFLSVRTGFLQIRKFVFFNKKTIGSLFAKKKKEKGEGISSFAAVSTALAGTIGTGSIAGIATAVVLGGVGSIFWMWVSAVFGMVTKYSEILLAMKFRKRNCEGEWTGGPMYYIENALGKKSLARLFAFFTVFACFGIGNMAQSNSIAQAMKSAIGVSPWITAAIIGVIMSGVLLGGMRRIGAVNEKLVPLMALFYITCALLAILSDYKKVPWALGEILRGAMNFKSATAGAVGSSVMSAVRYGFSRGVFSNEAGLGSAPIAHAASNNENAVEQALWGMFEVFFTTIVICTMSALVIIIAGKYTDGALTGTALSIASFDALLYGSGSTVVTVSSVLFAISSLLGWAYYGEMAIGYLFQKSKKITQWYRVLYIAAAFTGTIGSVGTIWEVSEMMNGFMALPNLIALILLSGEVKKSTQEYFLKKEGRYDRRKWR